MELSIVSLFSGGGGSSLGYKKAGHKVIWANEFSPNVADMYEANNPNTILCRDDIRDIDVKALMKSLGIKKGELDVLDGSPPCQAFSMLGPRHKKWGTEKIYENKKRQKNEDMFIEYMRFLDAFKPKAFIFENVASMAHGKAYGYFENVLRMAEEIGYNVSPCIINAAYLDTPQTRNRLYVRGIRKDISSEMPPVRPLSKFQAPLNRYLENKLHSIELIGFSSLKNTTRICDKHPAPALATDGFGAKTAIKEKNGIIRSRLNEDEILAIAGFPKSYKYKNKTWLLHVCGNAVVPNMALVAIKSIEGLLK